MNAMQERTLAKVNELAAKMGIPKARVEENEKFCVFMLGDFKIWAYPDGGAYFSSYFYDSRTYEMQNFITHETLLNSLITELTDAKGNKESYRRNPRNRVTFGPWFWVVMVCGLLGGWTAVCLILVTAILGIGPIAEWLMNVNSGPFWILAWGICAILTIGLFQFLRSAIFWVSLKEIWNQARRNF